MPNHVPFIFIFFVNFVMMLTYFLVPVITNYFREKRYKRYKEKNMDLYKRDKENFDFSFESSEVDRMNVSVGIDGDGNLRAGVLALCWASLYVKSTDEFTVGIPNNVKHLYLATVIAILLFMAIDVLLEVIKNAYIKSKTEKAKEKAKTLARKNIKSKKKVKIKEAESKNIRVLSISSKCIKASLFCLFLFNFYPIIQGSMYEM